MSLILNGSLDNDIKIAAKILRKGGLVAIPTETVYGLAASALKEESVLKIFETKGRPADNPLIVHISDIDEMQTLVAEIPEAAIRLAEAFWPGPLTMILKKSDIIPNAVSGGLDTVAIRLPASEIARKLIAETGSPLAAPSANISGRPSPTKFAHVLNDLNGKIDALLDGGDSSVGVESTVITLVTDVPRILRPGGITREQLESVLGYVELDSSITEKPKADLKPSSPGMKYSHYSPKADVIVVDASPHDYCEFVNANPEAFALCFDEDIEYIDIGENFISYGTRYNGGLQAQKLFSSLISLDERGAKKVYAHIPSKNGIGLAVYNRLIRSAGFKTITPKKHHIIGLTGASGTGKTTISKVFEELGAAALDCDKISKSPGVYDDECVKELVEAFGNSIIEDGKLSRHKLAQIAFASDEGTRRLNEITHPRIFSAMWSRINEAKEAGYRIIILDAPTLFEAGFDFYCSRIIAVSAPDEIKIERIMARDSITIKEAETRLAAQHDDKYYLSRADHIINGAGGYDLKKRIAPIINGLNSKLDKELI